MLVHGARATAAASTASSSASRRRLHRVRAAETATGLAYDPAYCRVPAQHLRSHVLVGHSYGGACITNAATGDPQVKALVYVDAFAPAQGQTLAQLLAAYPDVRRAREPEVVPFPGAPSGVGDAYIKQSVFPSCMANRLPAVEARGARRHPASAFQRSR